jgi:16S rRNA (guanine527-N7)-methyltransferase
MDDEGASALRGLVDVSRETGSRLQTLVDLVRKWQSSINLIAPSTVGEIWRRHVADSAQLVALFPDSRRWLDLGAGAGFPGLVIAILLAGSGGHVHLVESNTRKCAFLRQAIRLTEATATVHQGRAESLLTTWRLPIDRITARALAPLSDLFALAAPLMQTGTPGAFPKGRDFEIEIAEASKSWDFDLIKHQSRINGDGVVIEVTRLVRKAAAAHSVEA